MGWNGSDIAGVASTSKRTLSKRGSKHRILRSIAIISLFAIVAILVVLWQNGIVQRPTEKKGRQTVTKPSHFKEVDWDKTAPKQVVEDKVKEKDSAPLHKILGKTPTGLEYVAEIAQTNSDGVVVSRYQLADGSWTRVVTLQSKDSLVFETALDNQFALIAMTPVNQLLPPMPPIGNLEDAFEEAMRHPIVVLDSDSEKVKELKNAVNDIRIQMADLLREGYTVGQILADDASLRLKNVEFRREFQSELNEIYRTEGRAAAEAYMENANTKLEELGIIPLSLPESGDYKKRSY